MADGKDLEQQFHDCMPLFIALGDEMRLTIIQTWCSLLPFRQHRKPG